MISGRCETGASDVMALSREARRRIHAECPGRILHPDTGAVIDCSCACHVGPGRERATEGPFPVGVPDPGERAEDAPQDRKKAEKRPPATHGGGVCEHCGEPCGKGARFLPGHDAKLKSELVTLANEGGYAGACAWGEIVLRGWDRLVSAKKKPPIQVRAQGRAQSVDYDIAWYVDRRLGRLSS